MLSLLDLSELPATFAPCEFRCKRADGDWELREAHRLRRAVFCLEQGLFVGDDLDVIDAQATTLVALSCIGGSNEQLVGTVRIHEAEPALWWGSRLAVHAAFRHHGRLGTTLIRLAVATANARGCRLFLAHVQAQNVPLFERLGWRSLKQESLHGRLHHLMQAELERFPPCHDPITGYVTHGRVAR